MEVGYTWGGGGLMQREHTWVSTREIWVRFPCAPPLGNWVLTDRPFSDSNVVEYQSGALALKGANSCRERASSSWLYLRPGHMPGLFFFDRIGQMAAFSDGAVLGWRGGSLCGHLRQPRGGFSLLPNEAKCGIVCLTLYERRPLGVPRAATRYGGQVIE